MVLHGNLWAYDGAVGKKTLSMLDPMEGTDI